MEGAVLDEDVDGAYLAEDVEGAVLDEDVDGAYLAEGVGLPWLRICRIRRKQSWLRV